jgi:DNA mismatch endonuclease (patch repair protein)
MQANRSKNTRPELLVRQYLREAGLPGYRLHWRQAAGKPDVCYPGRKVAIFVNGCYWHRCPYCALPLPKTNVDFWRAKFARNQERDRRNQQELLRAGWTVLGVWECQLKGSRLERTTQRLALEVSRATQRPGGRLCLPGVTPAWKLAIRRKLLLRHGGTGRRR